MVDSRLAGSFWASVKDCLVTFHHIDTGTAADKVTSFWMSLSKATLSPGEPDFADIVYHSEPWYIACNLAQSDLPLAGHWTAYQEILSKNGLVIPEPAADIHR